MIRATRDHGPSPAPFRLLTILRQAIAVTETHVQELARLLARQRALGWSTACTETWLRTARAHKAGLHQRHARLQAELGCAGALPDDAAIPSDRRPEG